MGLVNHEDLEDQVKRQMPRPQKSTRSAGTSQSLHTNVFDECVRQTHADENATIHVVTKQVTTKGYSFSHIIDAAG